MAESELEERWRQIVRPDDPSGLAGTRAPGVPAERGVWLAVDSEGRRHLLVEIPPDAAALAEHSTRGLEVTTDELQVGGHQMARYVDLSCLDPAVHATFRAVAGEIVDALSATDEEPRHAVARSLERWKWFWSIDAVGLSWSDALGLLGELWFLDRWLGLSPKTLSAWHGPMAARHDFRWEEASIEVKATAVQADVGAVHRIQSLDQLEDPEAGQLYLFSLQVSADPLASNSLAGIVDYMATQLVGDVDSARTFHERLAEVGYNPAESDRYRQAFRVVAEELYRVDDSFPRLVRSSFPDGIPGGVQEIEYSLNLGACQPWRIATSPADSGAAVLRSHS